MAKFLILPAAAVSLGLLMEPVRSEPQTLMDLALGRDTPACPKYQRTPKDPCNIVVIRPGGNPTADMTGSIGHAKTWQSNGGPRCKTICRFTGTQY